MTLIVETGTNVANSNSYASTSDADDRLISRGNTVWENLDDDVKQVSLILATDYMTAKYRTLWTGYRSYINQSLDWPRFQVPYVDTTTAYNPFPSYYPINTVPVEVKNACIDLAARAATGVDLMADLGPPVIQETVGPITVKYAEGARQTNVYLKVDGLLAPFLLTGGGMYSIPLSRG